MNANAIVQKLWRLCTVLREDGITYQQYVTELTYLLFLKMMAERNREEGNIPPEYRWAALVKAEPLQKLKLYRNALTALGDPEGGLPRMVQAIFDNASTFTFRQRCWRSRLSVLSLRSRYRWMHRRRRNE